ncbi:unnamed protein product [Cuscuta campestris]|uniref:Uncharacterized protein n=1 Tax=Cuscuta campestris TaxID=132261 RepID=A0A484KDH1_9ASTE|nr:unnamed protein product [Cuscuta campestris]
MAHNSTLLTFYDVLDNKCPKVSWFLQIHHLYFYRGREIAEIYEQRQDIGIAIQQYNTAVDYFERQNVSTFAKQCKLKIAKLSAEMEEFGSELGPNTTHWQAYKHSIAA